MTPQEALAIKREARWGRFKDVAARISGVIVGLVIGYAALIGAVYVFDYLASHEDRLREERKLECLKEAANEWVASICLVTYREDKDQ